MTRLQIRFAKYENNVAEEMEVCVTAITIVLQRLLFSYTTLIDITWHQKVFFHEKADVDHSSRGSENFF